MSSAISQERVAILAYLHIILPLCRHLACWDKNLCPYFRNTTLTIYAKKTDQMDTLERITHISLYNSPITLYSISIQRRDEGLLNKPNYMTLPLLVLEI